MSFLRRWIRAAFAVFRGRHRLPSNTRERRPTGIRTLDRKLCGGLARGTIVHVTGASDQGFSELLRSAIRTAAARDEAVVWFDLHRSCVNQDLPIWVARPDCAEQTMWMICSLVQAADLLVLDSTAGLLAQKETTARALDTSSDLARLLTRSIPRVAHAVHRSTTTLLVFSPDEARFGAQYWANYATTKIRVQRDSIGALQFSVADAHKPMNACAP